MKILAIVPIKKNLNSKLKLRCFENVLKLQTYFQNTIDIYLDDRGPGDSMFMDFCSRERIKVLACVRQSMINDYLRPEHTHVLMVDADVEYTPKTVTDLLRTSKVDIVAPAILAVGGDDWWYDTWGFFDENGKHANKQSPYFDGNKRVVELSSVGTMYLVPADLFRMGAMYRETDGNTEHYSVCAFAKSKGIKTLCNLDVVVRHPRLDDYGERRE